MAALLLSALVLPTAAAVVHASPATSRSPRAGHVKPRSAVWEGRDTGGQTYVTEGFVG